MTWRPLLAQSRHGLVHCKCPLLGVKRTTWLLLPRLPNKADLIQPLLVFLAH